MPTLRVELLKSREEDEKRSLNVEKRVLRSSRVNMVAGNPLTTSLKLSFADPSAQRKHKAATGKTLSSVKKLSSNERNRSNVRNNYKGRTLHSPSESDSFSIKSSSSSSKSEADSIKKPLPPASLIKPNSASLSMSLGSYFGAQAVEMWDADHMPPAHFSCKAIHEKLDGGSKTLQDCFLEFKFSQGDMVGSHLRRRDADRCAVNAEHLGGGCGTIKRDSMADVEVLNDDWVQGLATPAFYSPAAHSPETSSEASYHSKEACNVQGTKHARRIEEIMGQHQGLLEEAGGLLAEHELRHEDAINHMQDLIRHHVAHVSQATQEGRPSEADKGIDRLLSKAEMQSNYTQSARKPSCPRHASQSKEDDGLSLEAGPISKDTYLQNMSSCKSISVDRSTYPEVVTDYRKETSARVSLEGYTFATPLMGRSVSSAQSCKQFSSPASLGRTHDAMKNVLRVEVGPLTPPPVHEIRCMANLQEFTPVSPLSLSEAGNDQRNDEYDGKEYPDMAWFTTSKAQGSLHSPSKTHWDWRSRSLGARASLKSAVRNLEAAFGGSRSVSLPKTRSQMQQREMKPESSTFIDRVFVSPVKARYKRAELLKPFQRSSYSGDYLTHESMRSRRELHADDSRGEWAGASHSTLPPLPLSKQHQKSEISDFKFSSVLFPVTSRSVHRLAPLKRLSGHTSPLASTPMVAATGQPHPIACMLQGYLQSVVRDGFACYTLSLKDSEEMLLAKACAFGHDSSMEGSSKWMYTFHSGKSKSRGKGGNGWRSWLKKDSKSASDLTGKMQVSSQLLAEVSPAGKSIQSVVSEFVLYDERNDDAARSQSLRFLSSSNTCHSAFTAAESPLSVRSAFEFPHPSSLHRKQVPDIPRSPSSARMSLNSNQVQPYSPLTKTAAHQSSYSIDGWSDSDAAEPEVRHVRCFPSSHSELVAIVIKMPTDDPEMNDHQSLTGACRRSLKFSDDRSKGCQGDPKEKITQDAKSDSRIACGTRTRDGLLENRATTECVTMVLPKEHHGLPKGGVSGPNSLIERWKCGGKCDCGGWDLGCGMNIFSTRMCEKLATTANHGNSVQCLSHNQPLIIYSQGKTCDALLNLSLVQEGYFILKFKNELTPLKAFAASVAILHSRASSSAAVNLKHTENSINHRCEVNPETLDPVSKGNERPAFLEVCKEIPTWCPSNHPVSPYGRV